jgi:hypothetical protein
LEENCIDRFSRHKRILDEEIVAYFSRSGFFVNGGNHSVLHTNAFATEVVLTITGQPKFRSG